MSHFPPLGHFSKRQQWIHTVTVATNKPCSKPKDLFVFVHTMTWWQLGYDTLRSQDFSCLGCVSHCQLTVKEGRVLQGLPFHTPVTGLSPMQNKCAFQQRPVHQGPLGTAGRSWQRTHHCDQVVWFRLQ